VFTANEKSTCDIKDLVSKWLSGTVKVDVKMRFETIFLHGSDGRIEKILSRSTITGSLSISYLEQHASTSTLMRIKRV